MKSKPNKQGSTHAVISRKKSDAHIPSSDAARLMEGHPDQVRRGYRW